MVQFALPPQKKFGPHATAYIALEFTGPVCMLFYNLHSERFVIDK